MMAEEHNNYYCKQEPRLAVIQEDLATVKAAIGYKEKSNGAFRAEVEAQEQTLSEAISDIHETVIRIDERQNTYKWILTLMLTIMIGSLGLIAIL